MKERSGYLSRQKNFTINLTAILFCVSTALAQNASVHVGAAAWGVANATVAASDPNAVFNNIAGIADNSQLRILSSYDSHYGFEGLNTLAFGVVLPFSEELSGGFTMQRFGDKLYSETAVGLGAGHRIGRFTIGLKVDYLQNAVTAPAVVFSRKALLVELGGIARLSDKLSFGAHIYNMTQSYYSGLYGNRVPTQLRAGFLYCPVKTVRFSAEAVKDTDLPIALKTGLAYQVWKTLWLRTGLSTQPLRNHFGTGFTGGNFTVDYAVHSNTQLGWSHHFTLAYSLSKRKSNEKAP